MNNELNFWTWLFFALTILFIYGVEREIKEEIKNHEKTIINEIRKSQIGV